MSEPENLDTPRAAQGKLPYLAPELICYGSLEAITKATSAGTVLDGGGQPNKNTKMA